MSTTKHHQHNVAYLILAIFIVLAITFIVLNAVSHVTVWYLLTSINSTIHLPTIEYPHS